MPPNLTVAIEQYFDRLFPNLTQTTPSLGESAMGPEVRRRTNHAEQLPDFR
jgi:hypothetical protein